MSRTTTGHSIRVLPATADRWSDLVAVMGTRGDPSWCWCQYYRLRGQAWRDSSKSGNNKPALREQVVSSKVPPGVIAYLDGEPAGWCAAGPKLGYPRLAASRTMGGAVEGVWSVTCFVVRVEYRGRGIASELLSGALDLARTHNASAVEAYPVDISQREKWRAAELFHGPLPLFINAGFTEVSRPSAARAVVRLDF